MSNPLPTVNATATCRPEFQTTDWSVVLAAERSASPEAHAALEKLCRAYWYPLYAFTRREGHSAEDAQDLTQAFFAQLLEHRDFERARRERGRLRSFLPVALKHFLINHWHAARAARRGGDRTFVALDELTAEERYALEPPDVASADLLYEQRWARTLLDHVLAKVEAEYAGLGRAGLFAALKPSLAGEETTESQAELAARLGTNENALKQALFRMRQRYRALLHAEIANTVATPAEVEDELRHLITVLRR